MARLYKREPFDKSRQLVVVKPFTCNGRHYKPGDAFDWRKSCINQRRVQQVYETRRLEHVVEADADPVVEIKMELEDVLRKLDGVDSVGGLGSADAIRELLEEMEDLKQLDDLKKHLEAVLDKE